MLKNTKSCAAMALIIFNLGLQTARAELLPSETVTLMVQSMHHQPDAERTLLTKPIIERMVTEGLSEIELFFKGEAYFLNFEPEPARDAYWELRGRSDDVGRVAVQRLMIIRVNAFDMIDVVLNTDIPRYRERFGIRPDDRYGLTFALSRAASRLAERGETDRALDLVADEVRRHDSFDAPYDAYRLPGQFMQHAESVGRADEFRNLQDWVLDGLESAVRQRLNGAPETSPAPDTLPGISPWSLFEDERLDYHGWTAEFLKLCGDLRAI